MKKQLALCAAAAVFAATSAIPAQAQSGLAESSQRSVRFDDLDLSQPAGRVKFERRLRIAADIVCGVREMRTLEERQYAIACRDKALADAQPQVVAALRKTGGLYSGRASE